MSRHRCRFKLFSQSGLGRKMRIRERCKCGEERERKPTPEEIASARDTWRRVGNMHALVHEFEKKLGSAMGYDAMKIADRFAKRHPDRVFVCRVDDDHFMGSSLVFVTSETKRFDGTLQYMGANAYAIPQCGKPVLQLFFYPSHVRELQRALRVLNQRSMSDPEMRKEHRAMLRWSRKNEI